MFGHALSGDGHIRELEPGALAGGWSRTGSGIAPYAASAVPNDRASPRMSALGGKLTLGLRVWAANIRIEPNCSSEIGLCSFVVPAIGVCLTPIIVALEMIWLQPNDLIEIGNSLIQ